MTAPPMSGSEGSGGWGRSRAGWSEAPSAVAPDESPANQEVFQPGGDSARYTPGQLVGQGGMGIVRVAEDRVLRRDVALKELSPGRTDPQAAQRMAREAWLTAWLDHPAIVAVHDAGQLSDGRPFYTMRLIRGRTLARALDDASTTEARLSLLRHLQQACDAVASAHAAGVVHRDLKPTNILIGGHGETQVIDWGLATLTPEAVARWPELERLSDPFTSGFVGTAGYASPEQTRGEAPDPRDDVFSLGAILRELVVTEDRSPELWAIADRACASERASRYEDAAALSAELLRWFEGRRVEAYHYTPSALLLRLLRAWRVPLTVGAVALVLLALAIGAGWQRTRVQRNRAVAAEHAEQIARLNAEQALSRALVEQAIGATADDARPLAERLAAQAIRAADSPQARGVLASFAFAPRPVRLSRVPAPACEWAELAKDGSALLCGLADSTLLRELGSGDTLTLPAAARGVVLPSEIWLANANWELKHIDRQQGSILSEYPNVFDAWSAVAGYRRLLVGGVPWTAPDSTPPCRLGIRVAAISSDERRMVQLCGDGTLLVGSPQRPGARALPTRLQGELDPQVVAWTPDSSAVVVGMLRGGLRVLDPESGSEILSYQSTLSTISALALSPDGLVAVSGSAGGIGIWDTRSGRWLGELPAERPRAMTFVGDELLVYDGALTRWRLPTGGRAYRHVTSAGLSDLAISPDGARLALTGGDGSVSVFNIATGELLRSTVLGDRVAKSLAYSADGSALAVSLMSHPSLLLLRGDAPGRPFSGEKSMRRLLWLADGALVGTNMVEGIERWADPDTPPVRLQPEVAFIDLEGADGGGVALSEDGGFWRIDAESVQRVSSRPGAIAGDAAAGRTAVAGESTLWISGLPPIEVPGAGFRDLAFSPDGARVATGGIDGRLRVWDSQTGALLLEGAGHAERIAALEFSPSGDLLVTASWDHSARFWDLGVVDAPATSLVDAVVEAWGER